MKYTPFFLNAAIACLLVFALNRPWGPVPALGKFLSPQQGFWQNAEPAGKDYNADLKFPQLKGEVQVYFDERMVPHVFAENEHDLFFVQGYLHAKFRLWQMEFQTHAAAGRISEIIGEGPDGVVLKYDRSMRRMGMVYAAERSVEKVNSNPVSKAVLDAYTEGVNAWIGQLSASNLPLEYKLLGYKPEKWSTLKTALFMKYMSYDLAGHEEDLLFTNAKKIFTRDDFEKLFPVFADSLKPVVPNDPANPYPSQAFTDLTPPADADSAYFNFPAEPVTNIPPQPDRDNGSNNWAVSGSKTRSGKPILCNDPHLSLNLPSLWYEMQLSTPAFNAYGVSFPGGPNIIIGFNDSIAFGFTNAGRDVKDYYQLRFKDDSMNEYWFNGQWVKTTKRIETIRIKGKEPFYDTIAYTVFGPVIYDHKFPPSENNKNYYSLRWKAHDPSDEMMIFYGLDHSNNYDDYTKAIKSLSCPGQNCLFASKNGDIAIWQQGDFPAKWRRQGDFFMPGEDSAYMWKGTIPQEENPHMKDPPRGFVSSANQMAVDSTYPYYLGNDFPVYRSYMLNRYLSAMDNITIADMEKMQTDNYNVKAEFARDILMQTEESLLNADEKKYFNIFKSWDLRNDANSKGATVFELWWKEMEKETWSDEFGKSSAPLPWPNETTLIESLHKDSAYKFLDNINTAQKETLKDILLISLKKATERLKMAEAQGKLEWAKYKDTRIQHLLSTLNPLHRLHLDVGGGEGIINATEAQHGPSWRMVVQLTGETEAYGVYPGGQNGNPGSKYYDTFVDTWAAGKYYKLWVMKKDQSEDKRIVAKMSFSN